MIALGYVILVCSVKFYQSVVLTLIEKWLGYEKIWTTIHQDLVPVLCVGVVLKQEGSQDEFGRARTAEYRISQRFNIYLLLVWPFVCFLTDMQFIPL